jgi:hypothetical protein
MAVTFPVIANPHGNNCRKVQRSVHTVNLLQAYYRLNLIADTAVLGNGIVG